MHKDLRARLVAEALERGSNLTDVVVEILGERYKVPASLPSGRKTAPRSDSDILKILLPVKLWKAIRKAADRAGRRDMDEVRHALCDHYGLAMPTSDDRDAAAA